MKRYPFALSLLATLILSACAETTVDNNPGTSGGLSNGDLPEVEARLKQLNDPEEFYTALREALIGQATDYYGVEEESVSDNDVAVALPAQSPVSAPQAGGLESAGESADSVAATDGSAGAGGNDVTSTNVQEVGVDEQDRVKVNAAGTRLFVLHTDYGYYFGDTDFSVEVEEPTIALEPEPEDIDEPQEPETPLVEIQPVDPEPIEPAVTSMPAAPPSTTTTLRILALDSETPDATSIIDFPLDLDGRVADGFYLYETSDENSAVITASGGGFWNYWGESEQFYQQQSVFAKVDVQDPANATLTETFSIDGQIISSRRIGDSLFFASRFYPAIPGVEPWQQGGEEWREAVESANLAELLPEYSRSGSDETTPLVNASSCFVAPIAADQPYYSPDIITLGVIDLGSMELLDSECFLGATETLYANTESVFLATTQYSYNEGPITIEGESVDVVDGRFDEDIDWFDPRTSTEIHQFDIQSNQLSYAGSGSVNGHLGWNPLQMPFRMSESDGYLRVATMNDQQGSDHSPILMNILQADGQGNLRTVSTLPNESRPQHIGEPGEQLYASRFLGDRAYIVTFRQTDPLYVIDLADPADPEVKGELKIDGYSDYLQPIGEGFLLGIGKDAVPSDDEFGDGRGAWVQGIKLALFDVSDPSAPAEVQSVLVGQRGTDSVALYNHKAITVQAATDLHPTRVSFGINVYGDPSPTSSQSQPNPFDYLGWNYTGLHGFDVTAGVNANISPRGALIVERSNGGDRYYPEYGDDRSVMVNDAVFYVHGRDVYPALWDNLDVVPTAR
ncbi:MAG: beta-propeller domain-containing protein [Granulosicoccus sp.]